MGKALRNVFFFKKWIATVELILYILMFLTLLMTAYHHIIEVIS
jgi:hypothetical protein